MRGPALGATLAAASLVAALAGCSSGSGDEPDTAGPSATSSGSSSADALRPTGDQPPVDPDDPALDAALSTPVEDDVYPDVGDPGVDALHYGLDLAWAPDASTLTAEESLVFRATADAEGVRLDLAPELDVSAVRLDGEDVDHEHDGKDLVVQAPVDADSRHTLEIDYAGSPEPVRAPTTRSDVDGLGWTVTGSGETWTMQEPFGAYSWYAVNDQPSDKALYDLTISAPAPMVGVANGTLESRESADGTTVTRWHLDEPASSYLTTIAIGDYRMVRDRSASGVPFTYWVPADHPQLARGLRRAADELGWLEDRLGPYPFSSLGIVLVDSRSGMETQTMITLGTTDYATSPEVLVHEMAHQWYGDQVTPETWADVWMNEGMAMYLQGVWQSEHQGPGLSELMDKWAFGEPMLRDESGPPADYDPQSFGAGNVYYGPALMWDALRKKIGDDTFWRLVRAWPREHDDANAGYDDITSWWSQQTGQDLQPFFDTWLLARTSPST
jgi:aminopeptidase N